MSESRLWILGASDPEMAAIKQLLRDCGERIAHATVAGVRVHPGNAYKADGPVRAELHEWDHVICVECSLDAEGDHDPLLLDHVDHHRPGDPGYGKGPDDFMAASSIGQVRTMLAKISGVGWHDADQNEHHRMVAAADHCLEAAYRGKCPGVDPDTLMVWRAASRAAFQKRTVEEVLADVEAARKILVQAATIWLPVEEVPGEGLASPPPVETRLEYADLRGQHVPELPEAAAREGIPFLAEMQDRDGRKKVVLQAAPPYLIRRFLTGEIGPELVDMYGDPARGFAGGYIS